MIVFIKQFTGITIVIDVADDATIGDITAELTRRRPDLHSGHGVHLEYLFAGQSVKDGKPLQAVGVQDNSTISEIPRRSMMASNADMQILSLIDPITLEEVKDPIVLDCGHGYERSSLRALIVQAGRDNTIAMCALCRQPIAKQDKLNLLLGFR